MPHSALGRRAPAEACCVAAGYRHLICRGREGWVDNRRIPLNLPLVPSNRPGPPQTTQTT